MSEKSSIQKTRLFIKQQMSGESTGHDWFHIERVVNNAKQIAKQEGGNLFVIEMAALLHDISDWKFVDNEDATSSQKAHIFLKGLSLNNKIREDIEYIIDHISFKGGTNKHMMKSLEGQVVQDADRLDALGAIGIARTFAFGGSFKREIYNPDKKPAEYHSLDEVKKKLKTNTSINHFYEKLLLLKDRMNTKTGKKFAEKKDQFMRNFLDQFFREWECILE